MIENATLEHHIQKHIVRTLMTTKYARFRDMRQHGVDTNLYSYHLKSLIQKGYVDKTTTGYTLAARGLTYVDRMNAATAKLSVLPKVITMLVIQNGYGGVLMYSKVRQPFINDWTIPFGKVHNSDVSLLAAATRELHEKVGDVSVELRHAGDAYIRIASNDSIDISTLAHVFYGTTDDESIATSGLEWIAPHKISSIKTAPAVDQIIARTYFRDPYFFEEYTVDW